MNENIYIPNSDEFQNALINFVLILGVITIHRAEKFQIPRFSNVARQLAHEFQQEFTRNDSDAIFQDFANDSMSALGAFYEELIYFVNKYKLKASGAQIELQPIPKFADVFNVQSGNMYSEETAKDAATVVSSISKLFNKLPKWAQRIIDVLLEILSLSKGG